MHSPTLRFAVLGGLVLLGAACGDDPDPDVRVVSSRAAPQPIDAPERVPHNVIDPANRPGARAAFPFTEPTKRLPLPVAASLVDGLSFDRYRQRIETLSGFGYRLAGSRSFDNAAAWLVDELTAAGYSVEFHEYEFRSETHRNIYVTKRGTENPDRMYIVSAHLDGLLIRRSLPPVTRGGAADDDASGVALVLEAALAFAPAEVETANSIRFVFWNDEESGLVGSRRYVTDRNYLQGQESPPGSGLYPEPTWLGVIQHDMVLFDHGYPPGPLQRANADLDIEYSGRSDFAEAAGRLAAHWQASSTTYSTDYPSEVGDDMRGTDSVSFRNEAPAISIRENKRVELERGWNPNWHQASDVYATYSDADFRLGFNALQMTVGAVAEIARARFGTDQ